MAMDGVYVSRHEIVFDTRRRGSDGGSTYTVLSIITKRDISGIRGGVTRTAALRTRCYQKRGIGVIRGGFARRRWLYVNGDRRRGVPGQTVHYIRV